MQVPTIKPIALDERMRAGEPLELIDVRTPAEFTDRHVAGAYCVPLHGLQPAKVMADRAKTSAPLYVICQSGARGREACEKFLAAGFDDVCNVDGGILAWSEAGLPVVRGRRTIPLDGQVRIAIGFIVLASALLSLVHPYFLAGAVFMGGGLIFSGVTGFCGLAMLMARAPWNGAVASTSSCEIPRSAT